MRTGWGEKRDLARVERQWRRQANLMDPLVRGCFEVAAGEIVATFSRRPVSVGGIRKHSPH